MDEVLIIGSGGREDALRQAIEASAEVSVVKVAADTKSGLEAFRGRLKRPIIIFGHEEPLVKGDADKLREEGYLVLGASKEGAQFEASKARGIKLARDAGIDHPETEIFEGPTMPADARAFVATHDPNSYVIKADALANGRGVVLPHSVEEAEVTIEGMVDGSLFDGAGKDIINFQVRIEAPEVSALILVGGGKDDFVLLPLAQDHKRLKDGDRGPNTGGMGAYAPVPSSIVNHAQYEKIKEKAYKSLSGMEAKGVLYNRAALFMGLMGDKLIEYNVRLGDPETQVVLPLMQHAGIDPYRFLRSAAEGRLDNPNMNFEDIGYAALSVCLAAEGYGYPGTPLRGEQVLGLEEEYENVVVQLAGAKREGRRVLTTSGRVLYVTGVGETIDDAARSVYSAIGRHGIHFTGMQYRTDIGWQAREAA